MKLGHFRGSFGAKTSGRGVKTRCFFRCFRGTLRGRMPLGLACVRMRTASLRLATPPHCRWATPPPGDRKGGTRKAASVIREGGVVRPGRPIPGEKRGKLCPSWTQPRKPIRFPENQRRKPPTGVLHRPQVRFPRFIREDAAGREGLRAHQKQK